MTADLEKVYNSLFQYCKNEDFVGWDPFDGLNSRIFQATPLKYSRFARLAWLQMVKRSGTNLRPLLLVPKGPNAKGIALFALAELSRYRVTENTENLDNAAALVKRLDAMRIAIETPARENATAFGYNFDWQSRQFFAPLGTPTIVPSAFAARAYVEAGRVPGNKAYIDRSQEIARFAVQLLQRPIDTADEVCFSYTPDDSSIIYNASLLACETIAHLVNEGNDEHSQLLRRATRFVIGRQRSDGAWAYGEKADQAWVDNFHTAFVLTSLDRLRQFLPDDESLEPAIRRGMDYWLAKFFLDDGTPKYYDRETYPVDIHSAATAIWALAELAAYEPRALPLATKVAEWAIANMRDDAGCFYYQVRRSGVVRTPFMRWGQAWMALALARLLEARAQ